MQGCLEKKKKKAPLQGKEGGVLPTFTWSGHAHYVHSLWAPHPPVSVHLERRWEEGNANKQ